MLRTIKEIVSVEKRLKKEEPYYITTAILSDGEEVTGYGKDFQVGDHVQAFFDDKYDKAKMRKSPRRMP